MNLGEMAFFSPGTIMVPARLLRALSIFSEARVFGLSYPRPEPSVDPKYGLSTIDHDLVFTSVPVELWPKLVRITIRLLHDTEVAKSLMALIADRGLNIVNYECTRGGFRSMTWTVLAAFEHIETDRYSTQTIGHRPIIEAAIADLEAAIKNELASSFFRDDKRAPNAQPLVMYAVGGLAFFHKLKEEQADNPRVQTFTGKVDRERIKLDGRGQAAMAGWFPCTMVAGYGFASIETHDATLRVSVIKPEQQQRFKVPSST